MRRPPTLADIGGSPLLYSCDNDAARADLPITDCGAHRDCFDCQFFDFEEAGAGCALEATALIGNATPELARLFGWIEDEKYPGQWDAPEHCPWFASKDSAPVPFDDPAQLDLLADAPLVFPMEKAG